MPRFEYIDKQGKTATIESDSAESALSKAPDIDARSGVRDTSFDTPIKTSDKTKTDITGGNEKKDTKNNFNYTNNKDSNYKQGREILYGIDEFDEQGERRKLLKNAQSQIDAIDAIYDRRVEDERKVGAKNLARGNTISAMMGMSASPDAATRAGNIDRTTEKNVEKVNELRALQIQSIYEKIDDKVFKLKEEALQTNRENAQRILDEVAKNAQTALTSFAAEGLSWQDLQKSDPDTFTALVNDSGMDPLELRVAYESALPQKDDISYMNVGNGKVLMFNKTKGGEPEVYDYSTPGDDWEIRTLDGRLVFVNPKTQEIKYANSGKSTTTTTPSTSDSNIKLTNLTPTNKRDISQAGLSGSDSDTQSFFLATPSGFRQHVQRMAASGNSPRDLETMMDEYDKWATDSDGGDSSLSDDEFMKLLQGE